MFGEAPSLLTSMSTPPREKPDSVAPDTTSVDSGNEALLERLRVATRGEYDIFGELGRGGMSTVYLAHEISLDRKVAIKVMAPEMLHGTGMVERFKREARTAANLSHANIIPIYAVRQVDDLLFCVIKLVKGTPLDAIIKELGTLPVPMVQAIIAQVGEALGYAHRHGVVHRDIKPGNILIDDEGWAVVTDFGIAKVTESEGLTMTGVAVGTPRYMSPEQCSGDEVTGAADQYSLGVVAYEMLAGRPPFTATSMMALLYNHFHDAPPPLESFRPDCPPELRDAVMRMLAKDPSERFASLEDAVAAMGARPMAHDDATRSQLITLARTGTTHRIVSQVQTPRSPIPLARQRGQSTAEQSAPVMAAASAVPAPKRSPVVLGGMAVALVAIGYLVARVAAPGGASTAAPAVAPAATSPGSPTAARNASPNVPASGAPVVSPNDGRQASTAAPERNRAAASAPRAELPAATPNGASKRDVIASAPSKQGAVSAAPTATPTAAGPSGAARGEKGAERVAAAPVTAATSSGATASATNAAATAGNTPTTSPVTPPPVTSPSVVATAPQSAPRPTPPVPVPSAASIAADDEAAVRAAIQSFASALAASDLAAARRAYPAMPNEQREGLQAMWKEGGTMTPRWTISGISIDGNTATARIGGANDVVMKRGQSSKVAVSLRARLERRGSEWRLVSLVN